MPFHIKLCHVCNQFVFCKRRSCLSHLIDKLVQQYQLASLLVGHNISMDNGAFLTNSYWRLIDALIPIQPGARGVWYVGTAAFPKK